MLRGDGVICGNSTTGTGTLTLAATPTPPGGIDFDVWLRAMGFSNSAALLVDYTIIEYTDNTFSTAEQSEEGVGTLTLGSSSGIANCTLARTTLDYTSTNLGTPPATLNVNPGTGITIGTAANCLVMVAPRVRSLKATLPARSGDLTTFSRSGIGIPIHYQPLSVGGHTPANQTIVYYPFPLYVRSRFAKMRMAIGSGGTYTGQNNNLYAAFYDCDVNGYPGKLLADFGALGTVNAAFGTSNTVISSAALGSALILEPGIYWAAYHTIWTVGGTGTPVLESTANNVFSSYPEVLQMLGFTPNGAAPSMVINMTVPSIATTAFADPATTPTIVNGDGGNGSVVGMWLGN